MESSAAERIVLLDRVKGSEGFLNSGAALPLQMELLSADRSADENAVNHAMATKVLNSRHTKPPINSLPTGREVGALQRAVASSRAKKRGYERSFFRRVRNKTGRSLLAALGSIAGDAVGLMRRSTREVMPVAGDGYAHRQLRMLSGSGTRFAAQAMSILNTLELQARSSGDPDSITSSSRGVRQLLGLASNAFAASHAMEMISGDLRGISATQRAAEDFVEPLEEPTLFLGEVPSSQIRSLTSEGGATAAGALGLGSRVVPLNTELFSGTITDPASSKVVAHMKEMMEEQQRLATQTVLGQKPLIQGDGWAMANLMQMLDPDNAARYSALDQAAVSAKASRGPTRSRGTQSSSRRQRRRRRASAGDVQPSSEETPAAASQEPGGIRRRLFANDDDATDA
jgi:hypothetical protein